MFCRSRAANVFTNAKVQQNWQIDTKKAKKLVSTNSFAHFFYSFCHFQLFFVSLQIESILKNAR